MNRDMLNSAKALRKAIAEFSISFDSHVEGTRASDETQRNRLDSVLEDIETRLHDIRRRLDPAKHEKIAISLGKPDALARFFAFNFVERKRLPLSILSEGRFYGSGVYAIYYVGANENSYAPLSGTETPIYVGKAVPARRDAETAYQQKDALWKRLKEHLKSIEKTEMSSMDFTYRYAVIQSGMESSVEDFMIRLFKPIWNKEIKVCYGIGKHGDAPTTRLNKRSPWDTMHPGRKWAEETKEDQSSRQKIESAVSEHFRKHPPVSGKEELFRLLTLG